MRAASPVLVTAVVCLLLAPAVFAQRDMGTILGVVTDQTGAVVPGANVTITEEDTGLSFTAVTDDSGNYIRPLLKPGTYTVAIEMPGFKKTVRRGIKLNAGERVPADIELEIGEVTQSIEITAATPALQTESTELGESLQTLQMTELPLGGQRKFAFLARLTPAVLPPEQSISGSAGGPHT